MQMHKILLFLKAMQMRGSSRWYFSIHIKLQCKYLGIYYSNAIYLFFVWVYLRRRLKFITLKTPLKRGWD